MEVLTILVAVSYVGAATVIRRQLPESISSMVYVLPEGGWRWLWTVWIWLLAFLLVIPLTDALPDMWRVLGFLTSACLMFCGAMPLFVREMNEWHNVLGVLAGILSQACVLTINPRYLVLWALMLFAIWMKGKVVFLAESICFASLSLSCH